MTNYACRYAAMVQNYAPSRNAPMKPNIFGMATPPGGNTVHRYSFPSSANFRMENIV